MKIVVGMVAVATIICLIGVVVGIGWIIVVA